MRFLTVSYLLITAVPALSCDDCYGPRDDAVHVRNVRRMQPGAPNATYGPKGPLAWGQLNFMHTTDTHGWLEGHIKEQNYGADWGDFVSFSRHMQHMAGNLGVDLLLVDTGDLHDGNGLSDAEKPDGSLSNPIFENIEYDLLTIGNHELYISDVAYLTFNQFAKNYGDRYLTSNVQILNPSTGAYEYIGKQYRYFTTKHGIRIMAFGVLYDFTGNSNASKVIKAADLVKQSWFVDAVNFKQPIDLFVLLGHNPVDPTDTENTLHLVYSTIRSSRPDIPVQVFGGHSHIRAFSVYDEGSTALESGRYCETLGWVAMSGIQSSTFNGNMKPHDVPNPTQKAVGPAGSPTSSAFSNLLYFRRYMDWNRLTFAYHAVGSQSNTFDYHSGLRVTGEITALRKELNLTTLYGCAPRSYCFGCVPFGAPGNIFSDVIEPAVGYAVVNPARANIPRIIIVNTGGVRFDLLQGPFTYDDSFIVSPFTDAFQYIANVPYGIASGVLGALNSLPGKRKRDLETRDFNFTPMTSRDTCVDAVQGTPDVHAGLTRRNAPLTRGKHRRQTTSLTPGYVTKDDFGTDGDDTVHTAIPSFPQPGYVQGNGSFPVGSLPATVDFVFLDFNAGDTLTVLQQLGAKYTKADVKAYLPTTFTTQSYLPIYAKKFWQANVPNCPVGATVGS